MTFLGVRAYLKLAAGLGFELLLPGPVGDGDGLLALVDDELELLALLPSERAHHVYGKREGVGIAAAAFDERTDKLLPCLPAALHEYP